MSESFSVQSTFHESTVLITGVTGFVGSLVLEQLLRLCPTVRRVYVLARGKKNQSAETRIQSLLDSGVFNLLWKKPDVLAKVQVINGDLGSEYLGLFPKHRASLLEEVDFVMHSAAAIALDDPVQKTLNSNYCGTKRLLEFCSKMNHLKAFCHVSTAFVNITLPSGTTVFEKIYPLMHGDHVVDHRDIADELLALSPEAAKDKASTFMHRFGFPNTYCLGKHLTEQLVREYYVKKKLPICIVRPSLIGSVADKPYPGYLSNLAGGGGFAIAFGVGFFEKWGPAWIGENVTDYVPADVVTSVILAATAATYDRYSKDKEPRIYHACTTTSYPITNHELYQYAKSFFTREPPPYCMLFGGYPEQGEHYKPNPWLLPIAKTMTYVKVCIVASILKLAGKAKLARRLEVGFKAWDFANTPTYDLNLFFSCENVRELQALLTPEESDDLMLLWTPQKCFWQEFFDISMAGVKCLLLKTPLQDPKSSKFRLIPPRDSKELVKNVEKETEAAKKLQ
jgi:fatty acyl-CoA reductase